MRVIAHGRRWIEDLPASPCRWLLLPAWAPWRLIIAVRGLLYDQGLKPARHLGVPVISIGNLTAGGTGKTPAALAVVALLRAAGRTPAILSRGYRGVDGVNEEAKLAGNVPVICNPDRIAGGHQAIAAGADCLVLDDGFQHRRLHRDLDIVLIDATQPWGFRDGRHGAVLPLGYLREGMRALRRADLVWLTRTDLVSEERLRALRSELASLSIPTVEERTTSIVMVPLASTGGDLTGEPLAAWRDRRVVLVSGIGNPAAFETAVLRAGLCPIASHRFPDHHHFNATEANDLMARAKQADATLVMTGKDAVKIRAFAGVTGYVLVVNSALLDPTPLATALAAF